MHAFAWTPSFDPEVDLKKAVPVWVSFPKLPIFLRGCLKELASYLGKVLHVPTDRRFELNRSPRVCVLWDARKEIPHEVAIPMGKDRVFLQQVVFGMFLHACFNCGKVGHFAKFCPLRRPSSLVKPPQRSPSAPPLDITPPSSSKPSTNRLSADGKESHTKVSNPFAVLDLVDQDTPPGSAKMQEALDVFLDSSYEMEVVANLQSERERDDNCAVSGPCSEGIHAAALDSSVCDKGSSPPNQLLSNPSTVSPQKLSPSSHNCLEETPCEPVFEEDTDGRAKKPRKKGRKSKRRN